MNEIDNIFLIILNRLHKDYRKDKITVNIIQAVADVLTKIKTKTDILYNNFFFNRLNESGILYFENSLKIVPTDNDFSVRRALIQSKWNSSNKLDLNLIQRCCDAWQKNGIKADFFGGLITLTVLGQLGLPKNIEILKRNIDDVKPAHIGFCFNYKYLKIKDIHLAKTVDEMNTLKIGWFKSYKEIEE